MKTLLASAGVISLLFASAATAQTTAEKEPMVVVKGLKRPKAGDPPPPIDLFVKRPRIENIALSPDGTRIGFVTTVEGVHILAVYGVSDNTRQTVKLADQPLSAITWIDNDRIMLSQSETGPRSTCPGGNNEPGANLRMSMVSTPTATNSQGSNLLDSAVGAMDTSKALDAARIPGCVQYGIRSTDGVAVVDLRKSSATSVGRGMSEFNNLALGIPRVVHPDGKTEIMGPFLELRTESIGGQPTRRVYLWRLDPDTGQGRPVNDGGGDLDRENRYVDGWAFDTAGRVIARSLYNFSDEAYTIEMQLDGKWKPVLTRKLSVHTTGFAPVIAGRGREGDSVLILDIATADGSAPRYHYYELTQDGQRSDALDPDDATRDRPIFNPKTGNLAGFASSGETTHYTFTDADLAAYYSAAFDQVSGQAVRVAAVSEDPGRMVLKVDSGYDAGTYQYIDMTTGHGVDIGSDQPSVPAEWTGAQQVIKYKAADGLTITGLLTLPPKGPATDRALVVLPHDGPLKHDARGYDWLAQVLASRGYVVLQPNYRGSDGYGQDFIDAGAGQWGGRMLSDMADGASQLVAQKIADKNRICIVGIGYGGYAALSGAVAADSPYACAAAIGGISDVADHARHVDDRTQPGLHDGLAALTTDPAHDGALSVKAGALEILQRYWGTGDLSALSPLPRASQAKVPVLLVHGADDKTVLPRQSEWMRDALKSAGKRVDYTSLPGCGHELETEACRAGAAEALVAFLAKYNPAE